jgi:hypothetical protein
MSAQIFVAQPTAAASISATADSAAFPLNQSFSDVTVDIEIDTAPTGTSPTLTAQLKVSLDGVHFYTVGSATSSLTTTGLTILANTNVPGNFGKIAYTVGGSASPTFPSVTANVYQK